MQLGMMNDPRKPPQEELVWAADHGFDFIDLTLEPPRASVDVLGGSLPQLRAEADRRGLGLIGHTAYYLPLACPIESLRRASIAEFVAAFDAFAALGVELVNIHPQASRPSVFTSAQMLDAHIEVLRDLADSAASRGLRLMVENGPRGTLSTTGDFGKLFAEVDSLGLHLDVGHANLVPPENQTGAFLAAFADRLLHVHFSDNMGHGLREDLHLPVGAGTIEWAEVVQLLKAHGYDGTITLEVFSHDRRFLLLSRDKVLEWWA